LPRNDFSRKARLDVHKTDFDSAKGCHFLKNKNCFLQADFPVAVYLGAGRRGNGRFLLQR
jgi:hypothetical protein